MGKRKRRPEVVEVLRKGEPLPYLVKAGQGFSPGMALQGKGSGAGPIFNTPEMPDFAYIYNMPEGDPRKDDEPEDQANRRRAARRGAREVLDGAHGKAPKPELRAEDEEIPTLIVKRRQPATVDRERIFAKMSASKGPPGWKPVGKKGGYRSPNKIGGKYQYWYPGQPMPEGTKATNEPPSLIAKIWEEEVFKPYEAWKAKPGYDAFNKTRKGLRGSPWDRMAVTKDEKEQFKRFGSKMYADVERGMERAAVRYRRLDQPAPGSGSGFAPAEALADLPADMRAHAIAKAISAIPVGSTVQVGEVRLTVVQSYLEKGPSVWRRLRCVDEEGRSWSLVQYRPPRKGGSSHWVLKPRMGWVEIDWGTLGPDGKTMSSEAWDKKYILTPEEKNAEAVRLGKKPIYDGARSGRYVSDEAPEEKTIFPRVTTKDVEEIKAVSARASSAMRQAVADSLTAAGPELEKRRKIQARHEAFQRQYEEEDRAQEEERSAQREAAQSTPASPFKGKRDSNKYDKGTEWAIGKLDDPGRMLNLAARKAEVPGDVSKMTAAQVVKHFEKNGGDPFWTGVAAAAATHLKSAHGKKKAKARQAVEKKQDSLKQKARRAVVDAFKEHDPMGVGPRSKAGQEYIDRMVAGHVWAETKGIDPEKAMKVAAKKTAPHRPKGRLGSNHNKNLGKIMFAYDEARDDHSGAFWGGVYQWAIQKMKKSEPRVFFSLGAE